MRHFELLEPRSLAEACAAIAMDADAKPVAGGTALLTIIKQALLAPKSLINLKKIHDGSEITFDAQRGMRIGALATINDIETSPLVQRHYPVLAEACHLVANIRIRNMATIGGNLAHADYQSDPPTVLAALDATVEVTSVHGDRTLKLAEFQRGSYETALEPGEIITAVLLPPLPPEFKGTYIKFTTGSSEERPCAGVAVLAWMEADVCRELRLAVGAVSPRALRITAAEEMAQGRTLDPHIIERIGAEASRAVDPIEDLRGSAEYKRHLVGVLTRRTLTALASAKIEAVS
jgi:aerobic carbon-monoxide dehydrogenase medium subunit